MEILQKVIEVWNEHGLVILGILLAISEGLALIPAFKSNSILQFVLNALKALKAKKDPNALK